MPPPESYAPGSHNHFFPLPPHSNIGSGNGNGNGNFNLGSYSGNGVCSRGDSGSILFWLKRNLRLTLTSLTHLQNGNGNVGYGNGNLNGNFNKGLYNGNGNGNGNFGALNGNGSMLFVEVQVEVLEVIII